MIEVAAPEAVRFDERPPGERYYRHPGDVLRLVLWGLATLALVVFIELAEGSNTGLREDLGDVAALFPRAVRQLALAVAQVVTVLVPIIVAVFLVAQRRWRRTLVVGLASLGGAGVFLIIDRAVGLAGSVTGALDDDSWLISTRFPSPTYVAAAAAATAVAKPWMSVAWRRAADRALVFLVVTLVIAGTAGLAELLLAVAVGCLVGAAVLVAVGAPNRRPSAATVADALRRAGLDVAELSLERVVGGRAQLYRALLADGSRTFVKVYAHDSRDADLLYRGYRTALLRDAGDEWPRSSLERHAEHEGLILLLARRAGVRCPDLRGLASLPDGSMVVAMEDVPGRPLDTFAPEALGPDLLEAVWREAAALHAAGIAHRALRPANIVVAEDGPVIVDLGTAEAPADPRLQAIDRAELLVSLAERVGPERALSSAARVLPPGDLAASAAFLQPLAISAATRKDASKSLLRTLRTDIATVTEQEPEPLEQLVRVRPRTLVLIATLTGAFYFLLPQLANVDDSIRAMRSANWAWLAGAVVLSGSTYVAAAVSMAGGVRQRLPWVPTVEAQLASSFVNRVTPANVGGMGLNVRYLQKAGIPPTEAVTGVGLNVLGGALVHVALLIVFFAWADRGGVSFSLPDTSKLLVVIAVLFAVLGGVVATRWGRRVLRNHVLRVVEQSLASIGSLARSPRRVLELFGGSMGVTLAYVAALACAAAAFDADLGFAQIGAVYLGSSLIAAAAPTPGGLGAMEAALVAGFTAVGLDGAVAVATVLSYRLATYWLPILPGWICFRALERRNYI